MTEHSMMVAQNGTFYCPSRRQKPPKYGPQLCRPCGDATSKPVKQVYAWGVRNESWMIVLACGHKFTILKDLT